MGLEARVAFRPGAASKKPLAGELARGFLLSGAMNAGIEMRSDMFKVIVERPRSGSRAPWPSGYRRELDSEDLPSKIGMRPRRWSKWLNENLAPLRRFLVRQAGRAWNDVFSEICQTIDNRSTVKQHVRGHIEDFVAIRTALVEGRIYVKDDYGRFESLHKVNQVLYVDPASGVLMRNFEPITRRQEQRAQAKREQVEQEKRMRALSPAQELHRVNGLWFLVRLGPLPAPRKKITQSYGRLSLVDVYDSRWDCLIRKYVSGCQRSEEYPYRTRGMYAVSKRQLASRELRRYGLR